MRWIVRIALVATGAVAAVALAGLITAIVARRPLASDPVYTPAQFAALHLRSQLRIGQTLFIKGSFRSFSAFPGWGNSGVIYQAAPGPPRARVGVFVVYGPPSALSRLRRAPVIGRLLPPTADHPLTGAVAVFRVRAVRCAAVPACSFRVPPLQLQDGGTP